MSRKSRSFDDYQNNQCLIRMNCFLLGKSMIKSYSITHTYISLQHNRKNLISLEGESV